MPPLHRPKRERFARCLARQIAQPHARVHVARAYTEAYGAAGHSAESGGSRLMRNDEVQARVAEIVHLHNPVEELSLDLKRLRRAKKGVWHEGQRVGEEPDHTIRLGAIRTILWANSAEEETASSASSAPIINISALKVEEVERIATMLLKVQQSHNERGM